LDFFDVFLNSRRNIARLFFGGSFAYSEEESLAVEMSGPPLLLPG
jgi:hypothetical protein